MSHSIERLESSESPGGTLSSITEQARQAYEKKAAKDCLDLTRKILLIDPDNAEAQWMRSSIQSEMHRDLENARAFVRQAYSKENPEKQSQPIHAEASELRVDPSREDFTRPFLAETVARAQASDHSRTPRTAWLVGAIVFVVLGVSVIALPRFRTQSNQVTAFPVAPSTAKPPQPVIPAPPTESQPVMESPATSAPLPDPPSTLRPAAKASPPALASTSNGTLAISSSTSVDIYRGDEYLGSVPVSLDLPAGAHTLEYRHGNLRRSVTHIVNSNETSKAMIAFDVTVQINSRPWAEVFMDGTEKRALGQTPLSGVRVPIGSVLIFENPQFQTRKYRVVGNETGIQNVFPQR